MTRHDPATPIEATLIRWRNRETRYDDGRPSKHTKVIAHAGKLEQFAYGQRYDVPTTRQKNNYRLLDRDGKDTGAAWYDSPDQPGVVHTPASGSWVHDVDNREQFEDTELTAWFGYDDRWIERSDDPDHFHVLIDARNIPVELWPTMGKTDLSNTIKCNGWTPVPGCDHYGGGKYAGVPSGRVVAGTVEMAEAMIRCRKTADAELKARAPARTGGGHRGGGGTGGGHDGEMAAYCLHLAHQGLDRDKIYELWCLKADAEENPAWPYEDHDFERHMTKVPDLVEDWRAKTRFPVFTPPPADLAAANGNGMTMTVTDTPLTAEPVAEAPAPEPAGEQAGQADDAGGEEAPPEFLPAGQVRGGFLDVTNAAVLFRTLCLGLGQGVLGGVFNRDDELVVVSRYGQIGYKAASEDGPVKADPPAQIVPSDADILGSFIAGRIPSFRLMPETKARPAEWVQVLPPVAVCKAVVKARPESWQGVPVLDGVTHVPLLRPDGSLLALPGYDPTTRLLFDPDPGVEMTDPATGARYFAIAEVPSAEEIAVARQWLEYMVKDFPFVSPGDRANYLGMILTPVLRTVLPPPWPQLALNAPQQGTGKSLLATLLRILYGGEEHPAPEPGKPSDTDKELRKVISTILRENTSPVIVFDNLTGVLRSGVMAKLLTGLHWSDRELGVNRGLHGLNDRVWVLTGNNIEIGGDLPRRTIWCTINANMENPETRTNMSEKDLPLWAEKNRGQLLCAALTLARAAMPGMEEAVRRGQQRTDTYGRWDAGIRHVLKTAGIAGDFWAAETAITRTGTDDEDFAEFLAAIHAAWGGQDWTSKQLALACVTEKPGVYRELGLTLIGDRLPGNLLEKLAKNKSEPTVIASGLGYWLKFRKNRWMNGYVVRVGSTRLHGCATWSIEHRA